MARKHLMVLMILLATACTTPEPEPEPVDRSPLRPAPRTEQRPQGVPVRGVVDGRTVEFANGVRVRISMLAPPAACWAADALDFAKKTLLNQPVRFSSITPGEANLELPDGTDYAMLAVRQGVLRAQGAAGPLAEAETAAAREKLGLWGPPCNGRGNAPTVPTAGPNGFRSIVDAALDSDRHLHLNSLETVAAPALLIKE
ncbi:hypothetical protein C8D88_11926 [Lentzea atacamensis]|uniref:TNase-like domain-containing protein n=1 Tax=Lentzea atacamensis TaxID=531938 RepID=A0A316HM55_9PSEU|nr:hypothetical protein [Lentzea atacamensis]PWK81117.1 hypothetical protein C8D88_11926 [Lentzea atacamensis]